jgi:hypothetical protein
VLPYFDFDEPIQLDMDCIDKLYSSHLIRRNHHPIVMYMYCVFLLCQVNGCSNRLPNDGMRCTTSLCGKYVCTTCLVNCSKCSEPICKTCNVKKCHDCPWCDGCNKIFFIQDLYECEECNKKYCDACDNLLECDRCGKEVSRECWNQHINKHEEQNMISVLKELNLHEYYGY